MWLIKLWGFYLTISVHVLSQDLHYASRTSFKRDIRYTPEWIQYAYGNETSIDLNSRWFWENDVEHVKDFIKYRTSKLLSRSGQNPGNSISSVFRNLEKQCPAISNEESSASRPIPPNKASKIAMRMCMKYTSMLHNITNGCSSVIPSRRKRLIISNGDQAKDNEFRHMALLGYGKDWKNATWGCGGSLISERYVLTAGHCISSPDFGKVTYIAVGLTQRSFPLISRKGCFNVKKIIAHPSYHSPKRYHDIALLKTHKRVTFDSIMPACLHTGEDLNDVQAQATGFGAVDENKESSTTLQKVTLYRFPEITCRYFYRGYRNMRRGYDHNIQMCYGDLITKHSTCAGDSGGPLHVVHPELQCMFVVIGVTSSGNDCGKVAPGIYTRVSEYVSWIENVVWPEQTIENYIDPNLFKQ